MTTAREKELRRIARFSLALPVRVESRTDKNLSWNEITRLTDVSAFGAGFNLKKEVKRGRLVQLTMPLPRQMRSFDYAEPQYRIWALVRSCITRENAAKENLYAVGAAFIGKNPPPGYLEDPDKFFEISHLENGKLWNVVELAKDAAEGNTKDLRRHSRLAIPTGIILEKLDAHGNVTASEPTVTENLSLSGAAIFSSLPTEVGEFVRVKSEQFNVTIISVVRGKRLGQDGIPRLHVEFVDRFFPLEGIE